MSGPKLYTMEENDIIKWSNDLALSYKDDLDGCELHTEVQSFKIFKHLNYYHHFKLQLLMIFCVSYIKILYKMYIQRIFLTMPVITATSERIFSELKIIKNYLRSSMYQERLSNLAILSIEHEIA